MYNITIEGVLNGFIVKVGCQTLVFNDIEKVASELVRYQKDPAGVEKEYVSNAMNKPPTPTARQIPESPPRPMQYTDWAPGTSTNG